MSIGSQILVPIAAFCWHTTRGLVVVARSESMLRRYGAARFRSETSDSHSQMEARTARDRCPASEVMSVFPDKGANDG